MREVVFHVVDERPGHLVALATAPALRIAAPTLEELQHEAREALIDHLGSAHGTYRVSIRRQHPPGASTIRPLRRPPIGCSTRPQKGQPV
ncbi:MAG: hypothetical protein VKP70_05135 [Cyanobacteriota bacterium]|nr:hypothetical protein [Cyanobacteriota bacterium]